MAGQTFPYRFKIFERYFAKNLLEPWNIWAMFQGSDFCFDYLVTLYYSIVQIMVGTIGS